MTKWPVHKQTHNTTQKHVAHQDARDFQKNIFLRFSDVQEFYYFNSQPTYKSN